ncbi:MAG: group III truncated hemoglobin [Bacteroidota bacterium]
MKNVMEELKDITTLDDIKLLVNGFYGSARENYLLGPVFNEVIGDRWPEHLEKMYRFWQTVLLGDHTYFGSPFPPHVKLPLTQIHFETWLSLWHQATDEHFSGQKADEAKWRANKMATMFMSKINYYRNNAPANPYHDIKS